MKNTQENTQDAQIDIETLKQDAAVFLGGIGYLFQTSPISLWNFANDGAKLCEMSRLYTYYIKHVIDNNFDVIFGPAYNGIPLAMGIAVNFSREFSQSKGVCYNRKEPKDHGEGGSLVGASPNKNDRVIIVDTTSDIQSVIEGIKTNTEGIVTAAFVLIDQDSNSNGNSREISGIPVHTLLTIQEARDIYRSSLE